MNLMSHTPSEQLLQRRRAIFGRAQRPAPEEAAPAPPAPIEEEPVVLTSRGRDIGDGVEGSRRRSRRVVVSDEVGIRRIGSFNFQARMHDVSAGGCKVELIEAYDAGDHVVARLPKLEPLGARVCWAMGTTAGIEFASGMHPAVFDSLLLRLAKPARSTSEA
jgi:hypothetical protein